MGIKELSGGWSFTEIGGGEGTKDGEWLSIEQVPTTVHVELLKAKRIPDPVSRSFLAKDPSSWFTDIMIHSSLSGYMSGTCSVSSINLHRLQNSNLIRHRNLGRGRREGMGIQDHVHRVRRRFEGTKC